MASPTDFSSSHILFSAAPAWGHVRPFCVLAARLVKENNTVVTTLLLSPNLLKNAKAEIDSEFRGQETQSSRQRVRVLSAYASDAEDPFSLIAPLIQTYPAVYQSLVESKSVSCSVTGTVFNPVSPPNAVVLDFFCHPQMLATRAITGNSVPIISWFTGHVATGIRFWGPKTLGGYGDIEKQVDEEAARTGRSPKEISDELYNFPKRANGEIVRVPGVPEMYDWEYFPQNLPFEMPFGEFMKIAVNGLREADACFVTSSYLFEADSINALKTYFSELKQDVFVIGPLLPSGYGIVSESARGSRETQEFLDKTQLRFGERSVTLISFGTVFWPTVQGYIEEVIEAFIEKNAPFILCYASPFANISENLKQRIARCGLGLISKWLPQQYILNHPATGWFMTHGGHNSVLESLGSGIPMICWPFEADQPAGAAHMSINLKVAFELIEVRTGPNGMKPLLRSGHKASGTREAVGVEIRRVIDLCRGDQGKELRQNAMELKTELSKSWDENGISKKEMKRFAETYNLHLF
ncbi:UDP-glycosyltransferase 84A1 [Psilocybe cubensis]|uniref:UDP-glycosyltransferase 84A1 n=2 Tax=Psilocybe cubensis TaxID=181762 RepID=A0ACB8GLG5_PSICU|nr:UDP-glycosyltransferase 84A1 [Psilocybe cubensis]KAH9476237.1 UDP-glycosyltransferase 84A1 [Psilocybe cubensis]